MWVKFQHAEASGLGPVEWRERSRITPESSEADRQEVIAELSDEFDDGGHLYRGPRNIEWRELPPPWWLDDAICANARVFRAAEDRARELDAIAPAVAAQPPCPTCKNIRRCMETNEPAKFRDCPTCGLRGALYDNWRPAPRSRLDELDDDLAYDRNFSPVEE